MDRSKREEGTKRLLIIITTAAVAMFTYYLLPSGINELQRRMITIFIVAAAFWATEVLPLFATSLLVIGFEIVFLAEHGGWATKLPMMVSMPDKHLSYKIFLEAFGHPIIILFMGGFLLSSALTKHGIDKIIAAKILRPFTSSPLRLIYGVLGISAFFSMWMSNTATAAMMLAIIAPIMRSLPKRDKFHRAVILAVPFGANIGGIGTPIGTPPNAVAFAELNKIGSGYAISFLQWMVMTIPLVIFLLVVVGMMLYFFFPPSKDLVLHKIEKPEKVSGWGRLTLLILGFAVVMWLSGGFHGLPTAVVALLVAAALTAFGVLDRNDVDSIDWNILLLMWGGLSMGTAMKATGLTDLITQVNFATVPGGEWAIAVIVAFLAMGMSTFMSNTATANLLVPITIAMTVGGPETRGELAILAALACSFAMALPVSTPPNAIAFATGKIPVHWMLKIGGTISVISVLLILLGYKLIIPYVLTLTGVGVAR